MTPVTGAPPRRVLIIGLGLIGGSLALGLRAAGAVDVIYGADADTTALDGALQRGAIDAAFADWSLVLQQQRIDVVVIAVPVLAAVELLPKVAAVCRAQSAPPLLTDVCSVKAALLSAFTEADLAAMPWLVPAHPIAGSEHSGIFASDPNLFHEHRVIVSPTAYSAPSAVASVSSLWQACGADVVIMNGETHDHILALTSHLPHILAYSLVDVLAQNPSHADIFRFAAGGFRDFTRIASSNPVMWRDIAMANRSALLEALDAFTEHTAVLRKAIANTDGAQLLEVFARAKAARDSYLPTVKHDKVSSQQAGLS